LGPAWQNPDSDSPPPPRSYLKVHHLQDLLSAWAQYAAEQRGMPTAAFWRGIAQSLTMDAPQLHKMVLVRCS